MINNAFLQARVSSRRLSNKVLSLIAGKEMLLHQIDRLKLSKCIDRIVVLTSIDPSDDVLVRLCKEHKIDVFRGDLNDVLSRYIQALSKYPCDNVVRITGDCPLLDWDVVDLVVSEHIKNLGDYTSNTLLPTFADGLDVEVIKSTCLLDASLKAIKPYEREHVTYYIYTNPESYVLNNIKNSLTDESYFRWTVDEPSDLKFISVVYDELYQGKPFTTNDVRKLLKEKPELIDINKGYYRNEGLLYSIKEFDK